VKERRAESDSSSPGGSMLTLQGRRSSQQHFHRPGNTHTHRQTHTQTNTHTHRHTYLTFDPDMFSDNGVNIYMKPPIYKHGELLFIIFITLLLVCIMLLLFIILLLVFITLFLQK